jgi:copper(I)-binding protein
MFRTIPFAALAASFAATASACPLHGSTAASPIVVAQMDHSHGQAGGHAAEMAAMEGASARLGPIAISGAYVRAAAASGGASAAYMTIVTEGGEDRLIAAASPAAKRVELHTHTLDDSGVARMRPVEGGVAVAPGAATELKPGGLHVMMMGLTQELAEGGDVEMTLTFEKAGSVTMTLPIVGAGGAM